MRRLAQRSGWQLASVVVTTISVFGETILLARYLGPELFGVFLLVVAFPEAVMQVLDLRVTDAMNRYVGEAFEHDERPRAVSLLKLFWLLDIAVGLACLLIVLVAAGPVAELLTGDADNGSLMVIFSLGLLLGTLDSASGTVLRLLDRFRLVFIASSLGQLSRFALVAVAVIAGGDLEAIVWARVAAEVLLTVFVGGATLVLLKRMLWPHRRSPISALRGERRQILSFLGSTNLTSSLKMASTKLDTMLLGALASPATVAIYRFAFQFARAPLLISDALYTSVFPTFARAAAGGRRDEIRNIALSTTRILSATILPAALVAALFGEQILSLVGGERYGSGGLVFALCVLAVLPYAVLFWLRPLILTAGHAGKLLRIQAVGTAVQLGLLVALVPSLEEEGAAIALLAANVLVVGQQVAVARRHRLLAREPEVAGA